MWLSGLGIVLQSKKGRWLIPSQGPCLGFGFSSWSGHVQETTDQGFSLTSPSLSLSLSFPSLSLRIKNKQKKATCLVCDYSPRPAH